MMPNFDFDGVPYVEAPKEVLSYYLKTPAAIKNFEETGYFIFHNVKVYETGKRDGVVKKMDEEDKARKFGVQF